MAELTPVQMVATGVSPMSEFAFRSLSSIPAVELAAGLKAYPPVELLVAEGEGADQAMVRPAVPLVAGARYRFELTGPDGSLVGEWDFRTGGPLHVVSTLPGNETTRVPLDTGIELEFDQDGVSDIAQSFSIDPATPGRFERHGRTWVFVPSSNLLPATVYTVSLAAGVGIEGSDFTLEDDLRFRFETVGALLPAEPRVFFRAPVHETLPHEAFVLQVDVHDPDDEAPQLTREVDIYQLPTVARAVEALATLTADLDWASASTSGSVPTDGLARVTTVTATLSVDNWSAQMRVPVTLDAGWYLLNLSQAGRDAQLLVQVSDVAMYALASETRTVVWVNDLARGGAVSGAAVSIVGGADLGRTDASGLLDVDTPAGVLQPADSGELRTLLVTAPDGRTLIGPLGNDFGGFRNDSHSRWWLVFETDRAQYRSNDTVNAWGVIRSRADRRPPAEAELRLFAGYGADGPPLATAHVSPTARGAFTGELAIADLPAGPYVVGLFVADESVAHTSLSVSDIRKPAFRIDVQTDRRVYLTGERVRAEARATFYDGTAAPGMRLRMSGPGFEGQLVTADESGTATFEFGASAPEGSPDFASVGAMPAQAEEGGSSGSTGFAVLPSAAWLTADASLQDGTLEVRGSVNSVDFEVAEQQMATGWIDDPSGEPLSSRSVSVVVQRRTWVPRRVGTTYDFVLKRTVPRHEYDDVLDSIGSFSATSGQDGSFVLRIPNLPAGGSYEIALRVSDAEGRVMRVHAFAADGLGGGTPRSRPYLESSTSCGWYYTPVRDAQLDEDVTLTLREGDGSTSPAARTLFLAGRLGLQDALVTDASTFTRALGDGELPNFTVRAVRIVPGGVLVTNDIEVQLADGEKEISVKLNPEQAAYAPGEDASVAISTTGADGQPLAADVIVRVMDVKLYAIGAAEQMEPGGLMASVPSGFLASYTSHRIPEDLDECGGGATSGGGGDMPREDFKDLADFSMVRTDAAGHGRATFTLPDDITSWEVAAVAFGEGLEAGSAAVELPSRLEFFVESVIAPTYLAGEEPIIQLRGYGSALAPGDRVRFTVTSPSLGVSGATAEAPAFQAASLRLPALALGNHELRIVAQVAGASERDEVLRTVRVIPTRLRTLQASFDPLTDDLDLPGGDGITTYVVTDAGRGGLLAALQALVSGSSARLDASLAADDARTILAEEFGIDPATLPPSGFNVERLDTGGLSLLPYGSPDLFLTARVALLDRELPMSVSASDMLTQWAEEASSNRERRIVALAGLAGLGANPLAELHELAAEELTVREQLWLALGLAQAGDNDAARAIERAVLAEHGRRLGDWARLEAASEADTYEATALALLLAAQLRDPISLDLSRYLLANPSKERIAALEQLGFVEAALRWLPRQEARFAWSVGDERHEETLTAGGSFRLAVTGEQRASLRFQALDGEMLVASTWDGEADYEALPMDPLVSITRTTQPAETVQAGDLVQVRLRVSIAPNAPKGCYEVTDVLPSGLAPVVATWAPWVDSGADEFIRPYSVEGQRVSWCVNTGDRIRPLGYTARVVTPGTYRWEPAVVQSLQDPSIGSATPLGSYVIR